MSEDNGLNQISQLFQGFVKPKKLYRKTTPVYFKHTTIGDPQNDRTFARLKIWVHKPTLEYPQAGIFIGLTNGAGSCYTRVSPEDLTNIIQSLTQWVQDIVKITPDMDEQQKAAEKAIATFDMLKQFQHSQQTGQETPAEKDIVYENQGD